MIDQLTASLPGGLEDAVKKAGDDNSRDIMVRVAGLAQYAGEVSGRGIFYAKRNAAVQFEKFSELLAEAFVYQNLLGNTIGRIDRGNFPKAWYIVHSNALKNLASPLEGNYKLCMTAGLLFTEKSKLNIEPRESDDCLMGTIGSGPYKGSKCTVSTSCTVDGLAKVRG